jgi:hypothetical protein
MLEVPRNWHVYSGGVPEIRISVESGFLVAGAPPPTSQVLIFMRCLDRRHKLSDQFDNQTGRIASADAPSTFSCFVKVDIRCLILYFSTRSLLCTDENLYDVCYQISKSS